MDLGEGGGIGRRAGLRIQWGNPWGFESPLSHHLSGGTRVPEPAVSPTAGHDPLEEDPP